MKLKNVLPVVVAGVGCVIFGILMGWRGTADPVWLRALVAGCAAGILAFSLVMACSLKKKNDQKT